MDDYVSFLHYGDLCVLLSMEVRQKETERNETNVYVDLCVN